MPSRSRSSVTTGLVESLGWLLSIAGLTRLSMSRAAVGAAHVGSMGAVVPILTGASSALSIATCIAKSPAFAPRMNRSLDRPSSRAISTISASFARSSRALTLDPVADAISVPFGVICDAQETHGEIRTSSVPSRNWMPPESIQASSRWYVTCSSRSIGVESRAGHNVDIACHCSLVAGTGSTVAGANACNARSRTSSMLCRSQSMVLEWANCAPHVSEATERSSTTATVSAGESNGSCASST